MNLYPALTFEMGSWTYFVVKMNAREVSENVKFASEVYDDRTLDEAIQRVLNTSRVKSEIVTYLQRQPWRFFSSIVVAALGGQPQFYPVEITDDPRFAVFADDSRLNSSFGVLAFNGEQTYYALDGQHRLAAIQTALDKNEAGSVNTPADFKDDELSVIIVVPNLDDTESSFMQKYRRLFANLNRYAKPMDQATNIIMDEDDPFAIITRRLISEHPFFRWDGKERDSPRIKTKAGKNLKSRDTFFTSLETLYDMNTGLLDARFRKNEGWPSQDEMVDLKTFKRFRPDDEVIDNLYDELTNIWDALLEELPILNEDPSRMRSHEVLYSEVDDEYEGHEDHLLFWPIGQILVGDIVRDALDLKADDPRDLTFEDARQALSGLGDLKWSLSSAPWRRLLVTHDGDKDVWRMRNEERAQAVRIGARVQRWLFGLDELDSYETEELRSEWMTRLVPFDADWATSAWNSMQESAGSAG